MRCNIVYSEFFMHCHLSLPYSSVLSTHSSCRLASARAAWRNVSIYLLVKAHQSRLGQTDRVQGTQAHFTPLACHGDATWPALRSGPGNLQPQTAAIALIIEDACLADIQNRWLVHADGHESCRSFYRCAIAGFWRFSSDCAGRRF